VVEVQMRLNQPANRSRVEVELLHLPFDLFLRAHQEAKIPRHEPAQLGITREIGFWFRGRAALAGIDHNQSFGMLDQPGKDGKRLGPCRVEQDGGQTQRPWAAIRPMGGLEHQPAGLDCMDSNARGGLRRHSVDGPGLGQQFDRRASAQFRHRSVLL
jgi:hypothetical protein